MKLKPELLTRLRGRPRPDTTTDAAGERAGARLTVGVTHADWPAEAERRLTYRLFNYWEGLRNNRPFPALLEIDGNAIPEMWPWCFVLEAKQGFSAPYFHYLGKELARYSGVFLSGEADWRMTLLDKASSHLGRTLEARAPVLIEDELRRYDGRELLFRSIMLPLGDDGATVTHVLGAANGLLK